MKIFELNHIDPIERIRQAIQQSMQIYVNRLIEGYYEFGTEASFQLHFSSILDRLLELNTNSTNESFTVMLEKTIRFKVKMIRLISQLHIKMKLRQKLF